jgi:hypothetical protein
MRITHLGPPSSWGSWSSFILGIYEGKIEETAKQPKKSELTTVKLNILQESNCKIKFQYFSKIKNKNFFRNSFFKLAFDGFF